MYAIKLIFLFYKLLEKTKYFNYNIDSPSSMILLEYTNTWQTYMKKIYNRKKKIRQ